MRQRDFHAGQSALGLMTRNTEAMFAPRMAQWEAFGKGLQDANAIVQNRHAFNEQLEQNRIQNEFKNKEFGFREKELQENQRQFNQRHALDKQNSATDRAYKNALTALHYFTINQQKTAEQRKEGEWEIAERLKQKAVENPNQITLREKAFLKEHGFDIDSKDNAIVVSARGAYKDYINSEKLLENMKEAMKLSPKVKGTMYGISRFFDESTGGFTGLSDEANRYVVQIKNILDAYVQIKYGNQSSEYKEKEARNLLDQWFANSEQANIRFSEMGKYVTKQQADIIGMIKGLGAGEEYITKANEGNKKHNEYFEKFSKPKTKEIQRYIPPVNLTKEQQ
ncbi:MULTISPECIES: hypothetical protein [Helicobacter]|uniref:hypothetical protein n=1 Tax=Helicobacter TaxID=209 RepID=UPI002617161C|nr:hypothetical protein [Helicobacter sp. UBA3407]